MTRTKVNEPPKMSILENKKRNYYYIIYNDDDNNRKMLSKSYERKPKEIAYKEISNDRYTLIMEWYEKHKGWKSIECQTNITGNVISE